MWKHFRSQIIISPPVCYRPRLWQNRKQSKSITGTLSTTLCAHHPTHHFSSSLNLQILQITVILLCVRFIAPCVGHGQKVQHLSWLHFPRGGFGAAPEVLSEVHCSCSASRCLASAAGITGKKQQTSWTSTPPFPLGFSQRPAKPLTSIPAWLSAAYAW